MHDTFYGTYREQIKVLFLTFAYIWKPSCWRLWVVFVPALGEKNQFPVVLSSPHFILSV